jgi:hypothetical protein
LTALRKTQAMLEKRIREQKMDMERSKDRVDAERKRGQSAKTAGAALSRRKKRETP